jgi:HSP20 family molecular chaperone IbpA
VSTDVTATYENGILQLEVPKKEKSAAVRVKVK